MSRPARLEVNSEQSWDSDVDGNFRNLMEIVTAIANGESGSEYTNPAVDLPNASSYDGCMAVVNSSGSVYDLYFSTNGSWERMGYASDDSNIGAITDNSGGSAGGSTGARVVAVVTSLATAQDAIATLAAWCNELRSAMVASGSIA